MKHNYKATEIHYSSTELERICRPRCICRLDCFDRNDKKNMFYQSNGKQNHRWTNESVWLACSYIENRIQCIYFICWHVVDCRNVWHNLTQIKRTTVLMKFKAHNQVSARSQLMCFIKLDFWWLLGQPSKRN